MPPGLQLSPLLFLLFPIFLSVTVLLAGWLNVTGIGWLAEEKSLLSLSVVVGVVALSSSPFRYATECAARRYSRAVPKGLVRVVVRVRLIKQAQRLGQRLYLRNLAPSSDDVLK